MPAGAVLPQSFNNGPLKPVLTLCNLTPVPSPGQERGVLRGRRTKGQSRGKGKFGADARSLTPLAILRLRKTYLRLGLADPTLTLPRSLKAQDEFWEEGPNHKPALLIQPNRRAPLLKFKLTKNSKLNFKPKQNSRQGCVLNV